MKYLLLLPLGLTGCALTSFQNLVQVTLPARSEVQVAVFNAVTNIAERNKLGLGSHDSIPEKKISYYGRPYHRYYCTVEAGADGQFLFKFIHDALMSVPKHPQDKPEQAFLEFVRTNYPTTFTSLEYRFYE